MTTSAEWAERLSGYTPDDEQGAPRQRFVIDWGVDDQRVRDVIYAASEAEALAAAKDLAHDLYESNYRKPTLWWKAAPYRDKNNEQPARDRIPSDGALRHVDPVGCGSSGGE